MALEYILRRVSQKSGFSLDDTGDHQYMLDYVNEAAEELWESQDYPGCLREVVLSVNTNKQLSLPSFVGELRAMREFYSTLPWTQQDMRPRYHNNAWPADSWNLWRYKGEQPLQRDISNIAPMTLTMPTQGPIDLVVTIRGSTVNSKNDHESVTMDALSKTLTKQFITVESLTKTKDSLYDITLLDADNQIMAVLDNDAATSRYIIVDVSSYPFSTITDVTSTQLLMEVLYKLPLKPLYNNTDEFPIPGYDNVIINKVMQLLAEDSKDDDAASRAMLFDRKAQRTSDRKARNKEAGKDMKIELQPHRHDKLYARRFRYNAWRNQ